jgi:hypothetical protein
VRTCTIEPDTLRGAERWIADRRTSWEHRLDRTYDASLARVAFADPEQKAQWFGGPPEWRETAVEVDFDDPKLRETGTQGLLEALGAYLAQTPASA